MPVSHHIDLNADWAELYINGVQVYAWQWSLQAGGGAGTNQLGSVDMFAGGQGTDVPQSYVDDVEYLQLEANIDPIISVSVDSIETTAAVGGTAVVPMTISNTGASDLTYEIHPIYPLSIGAFSKPVSLTGNLNPVRTLSHTSMSADPDAKPASYNPPADAVTLNYDGDNYTAIGWSTVPVTVSVAAMFPTNMTVPYAGMVLTSVDLYVNDMGSDFTLKIWDMGNPFAPGTLLFSQTFTPISLSWNNVVLNTPVYISGADIWVGYTFTQTVATTYVPGTDAGPHNPNGDFLSTGVGWSHLSSNPALDYNWNIRANLEGDAIFHWLSTDPATGTIIPGGSEPISVTCDAGGLTEGTYHAILRIQCNDPVTPQVDVPVTFIVTPGGGTPEQIKLDFELQEDFSLTFDPWTVLDVDGGITYGLSNATFPHMYEPMAFIAFNPASTTPPINNDPDILPHGGVRFGACFATEPPPYNDDWLISPPVNLGTSSSFTLWVKSYTDTYGLEQYNIGVSTTGNNPADFTIISGSTPLEAPIVWTEVSFDLAAYDGQTVYVAIQCVSPDRFIFMVDDITIDYFVGVPETPATKLSVYPNPATDHLTITAAGMTQVEIYNQLGQKVFGQVVKNDTYTLSTMGYDTGVYFVKIMTASGVSTQKVMIR